MNIGLGSKIKSLSENINSNSSGISFIESKLDLKSDKELTNEQLARHTKILEKYDKKFKLINKNNKNHQEDDNPSILRKAMQRGNDNYGSFFKARMDKMNEEFNKKITDLKNIIMRSRAKRNHSNRKTSNVFINIVIV